MSEPFTIVSGDGPIIATAIHDGHALRDECAALTALDDAARLREEDPFTARIAGVAPTLVTVSRSRFEVDLNRPRDAAVYRRPADAWGLALWRDEPTDAFVASSLAEYDQFYGSLDRLLRECIVRYGRVCVLDVHSYNHRRGEDHAPASTDENPEINVGTGSVDRTRWGALVERFVGELRAQGFDARENVKFRGGEMAKWIHRTFPDGAVCLALEYRKSFMDEWTGVPDDDAIARLARGLEATLTGLEIELARVDDVLARDRELTR